MNESIPQKPEISDEAYKHYMATEPIRLVEVSDPGHLLYDEDRILLNWMLVLQKARLEHLISNEYLTADGSLIPDATPSSMVQGALLGGFISEPGYDDKPVSNTKGKIVPQFEKVDTGTVLEEENLAKLLEVVSKEKFNLALAAAIELDPELQLPEYTHVRILNEINNLSPERVQEICEEMQKPTLVIIPANSFEGKINQMNKNMHYKYQDVAYVADGLDSPFKKVVTIDKVKVCIVEGIAHSKQQEDATLAIGRRREHEIERLAEKNMKLAGAHAVATLLQQSLIESEQTGDNGKIVDNWEEGYGTVTILNPEELADSFFIACASFLSHSRRASFSYGDPGDGNDFICGRASVQILEF